MNFLNLSVWDCLLKGRAAMAGVDQLVAASSHKLKGPMFDSWLGHIPGLQIQPPVRVLEKGN